jgi:hypothetical protein
MVIIVVVVVVGEVSTPTPILALHNNSAIATVVPKIAKAVVASPPTVGDPSTQDHWQGHMSKQ